MVKLSIVIPYYNTRELTCKLLNSLKPQITDEVEVIVVDDGCYEDRLEHYDIYKWSGWIKLVQQENQGVSGARNTGIEIAQGKYIAFIDSDDMIMPYYIEELLKLIDTRTEDIIYFNWLDKNTNDVIRYPKNCAVWKAIYKKEILPFFNEKLKAGEDYYFQKDLKEHTSYYYDRVLYIYNSGRQESLTQRKKRGEL